MKVLLFILLISHLLFGQRNDLNHLLTITEQGNINKAMALELEKFFFDSTKITTTVSAQYVLSRFSRQTKNLIFRNLNIRDSLLITPRQTKKAKLIFINCRFTKPVKLTGIRVEEHLAFIGCHFKQGLHVNRISCRNVSFFANRLDKGFDWLEDYGQDRVNNFIFMSNSAQKFTLNAFNAHRNAAYTGRIYFDYFSFFINKVDSVDISGAYCENLLLIFGNLLKTLTLDDLKLNYLLSVKFNVVNRFRIVNWVDKEQALISIASNSIRELSVTNSTVRFASVSNNRLRQADFRSLKTFLSFQLTKNFFPANGQANFTDCSFATIHYKGSPDSLVTAYADTTDDKKQPIAIKGLGTPPQFPLSPTKGNRRFVQLYPKWFTRASENRLLALNFVNTMVDEKNWHIHFNEIRRINHRYRINPADSSLSSRHEVYTAIYNAYRRQGRWQQADDCYYEWKQFERRNYWTLSADPFLVKLPKTLFNYLNWISCGYGIKPLRIFPFAVLVVFLFALFYFFTPQPISNLEHHLISADKIKKRLNKLSAKELKETFSEYDFKFRQHKQDLIDDIVSTMDREELSRILKLEAKSRFNLNYLWNCFYFSFSTFTTVGLGDWYPTGNLNRAIVMIEGALGWLSLGLFITTYANVLLR